MILQRLKLISDIVACLSFSLVQNAPTFGSRLLADAVKRTIIIKFKLELRLIWVFYWVRIRNHV